ncbi:MAG: glycine--tRNA ligase [Candidatus Taylorbacteria bacterium]|nr:glycine--tRNA ligase [Candidatus Taylorbacteria bacterium]
MEKLVSLCKRRGFVYQGSEIYGGLAGTWDYGPLGVALRNNIKNLWWKKFVTDREDMYGVDASILMNQKVWQASGHVGGFADPLVECKKCKHRFRADHIEDKKKCPDCKGELGEARQFNMMFKTNVGATEDESSVSYLRPETAQGMFVNFKNILDTFHPTLPFGLAQIGKAFRNEIAPRDFIFRQRELEQMEIEYFVDPRDSNKIDQTFNELFEQQMEFLKELGLSSSKIHKIEVPDTDRAHYSKRSVDTEFDFPFGQKELLGIAYRTDYDLKAHTTASGVDLTYYDEATKERLTPHCIEPTFGLDRLMLAVISDAYTEDQVEGETRVFLKFLPNVAPVKVAVFPLLKNKPVLVEKAREVYTMLKMKLGAVEFDDNGNIGKRYRRQDEIGTPYCVTIDFDTIDNNDVTVRDRDSGKQERVALEKLVEYIKI